MEVRSINWTTCKKKGNVSALMHGYTILRTDRSGWIELSTDGEQMWVEVE
jgi:hypothetical protein